MYYDYFRYGVNYDHCGRGVICDDLEVFHVTYAIYNDYCDYREGLEICGFIQRLICHF